MLVQVRVIPEAKESRIEQKDENKFCVWVKEKPFQGEATCAVRKILSGFLNKDLSQIRLVRGSKSRHKIFEVY